MDIFDFKVLVRGNQYANSAAFIVIVSLLTGIIFSRLHQKLTMGYRILIINRLIKMNWLRTFLWTLRIFLLML